MIQKIIPDGRDLDKERRPLGNYKQQKKYMARPARSKTFISLQRLLVEAVNHRQTTNIRLDKFFVVVVVLFGYFPFIFLSEEEQAQRPALCWEKGKYDIAKTKRRFSQNEHGKERATGNR